MSIYFWGACKACSRSYSHSDSLWALRPAAALKQIELVSVRRTAHTLVSALTGLTVSRTPLAQQTGAVSKETLRTAVYTDRLLLQHVSQQTRQLLEWLRKANKRARDQLTRQLSYLFSKFFPSRHEPIRRKCLQSVYRGEGKGKLTYTLPVAQAMQF